VGYGGCSGLYHVDVTAGVDERLQAYCLLSSPGDLVVFDDIWLTEVRLVQSCRRVVLAFGGDLGCPRSRWSSLWRTPHESAGLPCALELWLSSFISSLQTNEARVSFNTSELMHGGDDEVGAMDWRCDSESWRGV
jgi:hypothetical protein